MEPEPRNIPPGEYIEEGLFSGDLVAEIGR